MRGEAEQEWSLIASRFFNEIDLLELRFNVLWDVVDYFVIAEAPYTHSGKPKPLNLMCGRFKQYESKINYIIVHDMPMTPEEIKAAITPQDRKWLDTGYQLGDDWVRERYQRNALLRGLIECKPDDIIILEDADEIMRPEVVENLPNIIVDGSNAVEQALHTCYFNWRCTNMPWWGTKVLRYKFFNNPSEHRFHTPAANYIYNGGWHFNFLGGADAIRAKIMAYAHQEFNTPTVLEGVEDHLANRTDVLGRLYQYKIVPIDEHFPRYLLDNLDRFDQYIYKG